MSRASSEGPILGPTSSPAQGPAPTAPHDAAFPPEFPPEFPPFVILKDPGRAVFVKLINRGPSSPALYGHLDGPGTLPNTWRPIPHNPVGEWSRNPRTGLLIFTHARGTFEEQNGQEFWREIQNGETFYVFERVA